MPRRPRTPEVTRVGTTRPDLPSATLIAPPLEATAGLTRATVGVAARSAAELRKRPALARACGADGLMAEAQRSLAERAPAP